MNKPIRFTKTIARTRIVAKPRVQAKDPDRIIKLGFWLYFILLIFEGALRKWILPNLATPLLVVRDPVVIWIFILAWKRGIFPANIYLVGMVLIGIVGLFAAILVGHGNLNVALYGARILVLHFPLMFVIGRVFNRDDVIKMGKVILYLSIPMAFLIAIQFYSPQTALVNRGIGGEGFTGGFAGGGALGFFRPPGTFSFTNGTTLFFGLTAPFIIYFWLNVKLINRFLLLGATAALLASIPLSISRTLLFQVILTVVFALMATSRKPKYFGPMLIAIAGVLVALFILSTTSFFQTAIQAFSNRFETANDQEGGLEGTLMDRYFGGMLSALEESSTQPFFGFGIGMGTNVGSMLLSGRVEYLISEGEWGRLIGELGPILGIAAILIRTFFGVELFVKAYKKLTMGDLLPWMLLPFCLTQIPQGQWAQPTSLGFGILIGGLILAALRGSGKKRIAARNNIIVMKANVKKKDVTG